jgi:carbamate kinase
VVLNEYGWSGIEAVVDKDRMSAKMAAELGADALLLLTDAPAVIRGFGTESAEEIRFAMPGDLDLLAFDRGSMGPKVEAACWFVRESGGIAGIGHLADAEAILQGCAGTLITATGGPG